MVQASQKSVVWTVIIASVVIMFAAYLMVNSVKNDIPEAPIVPTAAEIASLITVPEIPAAPEVNNEMINKLCELTDGCEFYEGSLSELSNLYTTEAQDDFKEAVADLINLDEDDFTFVSSYASMYKDGQVRAYSEEDKDDGNWECKVFLRVKYHDLDADFGENEVLYVVLTSVLDEGDYDKLTIEEVPRTFEF